MFRTSYENIGQFKMGWLVCYPRNNRFKRNKRKKKWQNNYGLIAYKVKWYTKESHTKILYHGNKKGHLDVAVSVRSRNLSSNTHNFLLKIMITILSLVENNYFLG